MRFEPSVVFLNGWLVRKGIIRWLLICFLYLRNFDYWKRQYQHGSLRGTFFLYWVWDRYQGWWQLSFKRRLWFGFTFVINHSNRCDWVLIENTDLDFFVKRNQLLHRLNHNLWLTITKASTFYWLARLLSTTPLTRLAVSEDYAVRRLIIHRKYILVTA
jgi:hypothetical protein